MGGPIRKPHEFLGAAGLEDQPDLDKGHKAPYAPGHGLCPFSKLHPPGSAVAEVATSRSLEILLPGVKRPTESTRTRMVKRFTNGSCAARASGTRRRMLCIVPPTFIQSKNEATGALSSPSQRKRPSVFEHPAALPNHTLSTPRHSQTIRLQSGSHP